MTAGSIDADREAAGLRTAGRVGVLGFGTMGAGIAQVAAAAGAQVHVWDTDDAALGAGMGRIGAFLAGGVQRGKVTEAQRDATLARITTTTSLDDLAGVDLVVEAVVEVRDVKVALLPRVAAAAGPDAVIATNTSALSVTDLAAHVPGPHRVAGMHFFNPAPLMPLVEVVRALQSAPETVERVVGAAEAFGKRPVVVEDRPGFLVNRILMPYLNDVIAAYDDGLASAEDIDTAIRLGLGHPRGPLELLDLIGLDTHHHATSAAYAATHDPVFAPPPLLTRMVEARRLGCKSGSGFRTGEGA
jgi:3-hydroxybutyryl-CoA dehydrogenase